MTVFRGLDDDSARQELFRFLGLALDFELGSTREARGIPRAKQTLECVRVSYEKGRVNASVDGRVDPMLITLGQKPAHFADEHEVRLVVIRKPMPTGCPAPNLEVVAEGISGYVETFDLPGGQEVTR